ncbi:pantoate--beta-alanine ligase [Sulfurimonas sp.]|uniref:pantoate--beta-alanine ligase n=1 Tax=Sulfurimonas sp. TaxID=2022749 RepID=UPI002616B9BB|nr:pantoate--beta-alanine ligase [Sulfurimonas sp.]MCW8894715.1 pantoate--beta-alanine ligase [Sulfurimonas sp.]MCW9066926.1 pantoate--beta-alanine ligase [Sulfurimonas sp.]
MKIISNPFELKEYLKNKNETVGFVPTMGALHEGHISLIKKAKEQNELVVVSVFLNPTQFLKGEDLDTYPKKDEADKHICKLSGVDILFFPKAEDIYGDDEVTINAPKVRGFVLEGNSRPSHFNGVLTVVMKLLNIVNPTRAYFGKKDAQQLNLISLMVKQLFMSVEIVAVDTVRESGGLALSSRNAYLSVHERQEALKISASLHSASMMVSKKILDSKEIVKKMREILSPLEIFYVEVLNRDFEQISHVEIGNTVILVEVKVGTTRLLDNIWL